MVAVLWGSVAAAFLRRLRLSFAVLKCYDLWKNLHGVLSYEIRGSQIFSQNIFIIFDYCLDKIQKRIILDTDDEERETNTNNQKEQTP